MYLLCIYERRAHEANHARHITINTLHPTEGLTAGEAKGDAFNRLAPFRANLIIDYFSWISKSYSACKYISFCRTKKSVVFSEVKWSEVRVESLDRRECPLPVDTKELGSLLFCLEKGRGFFALPPKPPPHATLTRSQTQPPHTNRNSFIEDSKWNDLGRFN